MALKSKFAFCLRIQVCSDPIILHAPLICSSTRPAAAGHQGGNMKLASMLRCAAFGVFGLTALAAQAEDTIKVGLIAPFSGPFADYGKQMQGGIKAYMQDHGDNVTNKKNEQNNKDTSGPSPEFAMRLAQERAVRVK